MPKYQEVSAFILAGGTSSRMACNKGLMKFGGEPLICHTERILRPLVLSVTVIGPSRLYRRLGLHSVADRVPGVRRVPAYQGPLAGIITALGASSAPWNLILACDLPYLSTGWIDGLLSRAVHSKAQAFVPYTRRGLEPLAAAYRREGYGVLAEAFREGVRKVTDALTRIPTERVAIGDLGQFEDSDLILKNMNTPEDFALAQKWWNSRNLASSDGATVSKPGPRRRVPRQNK